MLKYRLIFGTLMTIFFTAVVILDGWFDGSLSAEIADKTVQGTGLCVLIAILAIPAQFEISRLAVGKGLKIFLPVSIVGTMLLATCWYWPQFTDISQGIYVSFVLAIIFLALAWYQYTYIGTSGFLANCGMNLFSIIYLGLFSGFVLGIRVKFGVWPLLMLIFVVKSSDIGAYAIGKLFGRHKFCPKLSPGKTWEGMFGAVLAAVLVSVLFVLNCDIINIRWPMAVLFGVCFAFIGQFGDLVESMIKRDAEQKDSSSNVPGFGGILDVIDSPLAASVFGYAFFMFSMV